MGQFSIKKFKNNPLSLWFTLVDLKLFDKHVTKKKKQKIIYNAEMIHRVTSPCTIVLYSSEDEDIITDVRENSFRTGIYNSVAPLS